MPTQKELQNLTERLAGELIAHCVDPHLTSRHTGAIGETADCIILNGSKWIGTIEITSDANEVTEGLRGRLGREGDGDVLSIDGLPGTWHFQITHETKLDLLDAPTCKAIVDSLIKADYPDHCVKHKWDCDERRRLMKLYGLTGIRKIDDTGSAIYRIMIPQFSMIDPNPDLLVEEIERILEMPRIRSKVSKLIERADGTETHLAILLGSATNSSVEFKMNSDDLAEYLPERRITLPEGVTNVWFLALSFGRAIRYRSVEGWTHFLKENYQQDILLPAIQELRKAQ